MDNIQRQTEMRTLADILGLSDDEAIFAFSAAKEFIGCRAEICTYMAALLSHIADIAEEEGVG